MSIYQFARGDRRHVGLVPLAARHRSTFFRAFAAIARHATRRLDGFLHRMIEALAAAKMRRLERELQFRGVTYSGIAKPYRARNK